jgi:hypothetical protein
MTHEAPPENLPTVMVSSPRIWFHFPTNQCVLEPLAGQPRCQFIQGGHHVLIEMGLAPSQSFLGHGRFRTPRFAYRPRSHESSQTDEGKTLLEYIVHLAPDLGLESKSYGQKETF